MLLTPIQCLLFPLEPQFSEERVSKYSLKRGDGLHVEEGSFPKQEQLYFKLNKIALEVLLKHSICLRSNIIFI